MIGKLVSHYRIIECLGGGGMGVVYKAEDTKLKRMVALKFLPPAFSTDPTVKERFIHEAQAASALQHSNICTIHEVNESEDGQMYIVMDYYEGQTLRLKIDEGRLNIDECLDITLQIAQGLNKAHEQVIIHRDIKPANIMITKDDEVKILDFGLAKYRGQTKLTKNGSTLGTVAYMSPEQARGEGVDHRSDIWSLGVVLYEMISGKLPFEGNYDQAVIYSIQNEEPESLASMAKVIPDKLDQIVGKCMKKNQNERYNQTGELLNELNQLKESLQIKSKMEREKLITKSSKREKNLRLLPTILSSIAIILVIGYFIIDRLITTAEPEKDTAVESTWENSIAVLPFADLSPEKDQEFFCDGVTEQILTSISKLKRLKVIARTSIIKYKVTDKSIPQIGEELNVENILEGSASKIGNRIRVTAQLVKSEDGAHLWAENYDFLYDIDSVFAIYDDVSQAIATNLLNKLTVQEIAEIKTDRPNNIENYDRYMQARGFHQKFLETQNPDYLYDAILLLKEILKKEPDYLSANVELADVYNSHYNMVAETDKEKSRYFQLQKKYIDIAFNLNPKSLDVKYVKMNVSNVERGIRYYDEIRFRELMEYLKINPNRASAYLYVGIWLMSYDLVHQSLLYYNKAVELNPLFTWNYSCRGRAYFRAGEYEKAELDHKKALQIEPHDYGNVGAYIHYLISFSRIKEAEKLIIQWQDQKTNDNDLEQLRTWLYAVKGDKKNALSSFNKITFVKKYDASFTLAVLYLLLNDQEKAMELIIEGEKEYSSSTIFYYRPVGISRSRYFMYLNLPYYETLHNDPRFQKILAKHKTLYEENLRKYGDLE